MNTYTEHARQFAEDAAGLRESLDRMERLLSTACGLRTTFSAPGAPPRPGLVWKEESHRWINPHTEQAAVATKAATANMPANHQHAARAHIAANAASAAVHSGDMAGAKKWHQQAAEHHSKIADAANDDKTFADHEAAAKAHRNAAASATPAVPEEAAKHAETAHEASYHTITNDNTQAHGKAAEAHTKAAKSLRAVGGHDDAAEQHERAAVYHNGAAKSHAGK